MSEHLPYIALYVGDFLSDNVAGCSLGAQGLWLRMMFVMHKSERYGYLVMNGLPMPDEFVARKCGATLVEYQSLLAELSAAGVPGKTADGIIYSRRMVRDAQERQKAAERKRKQRAADEAGHAPGHASVTPDVTGGSRDKSLSVSPSASENNGKKSSAAAAAGKDSPDPRVAGLTKFFYDKLEAHLKEKPTGFNGGQAGDVWKKLLKEFDVPEIQRRIENWFASTRPFIQDNVQAIGIFRNSFAGLKNGPINKQEFGGNTNGKQPVAGFSAPGRNRLTDPE